MDKITSWFTSKQEYRDFCLKYSIDSDIKLTVGGTVLSCVVAGCKAYHGAVQVHLRVKKGEG
jgi:hypothetical protein